MLPIGIHFLALLAFAPVEIIVTVIIEFVRGRHLVIIFVISRLVDFIRIHVVLIRRVATFTLLNIIVDPFVRRRPTIRVVFHFIELFPISLHAAIGAHKREKLV